MELMGIKTNKLIAEFIGTFILTFAVLASVNGLLGATPTPVVAGFALFLSVLAIGTVSGSHINPAVTVALYSLKKIDLANAIGYVTVQLLAGLIAVIVLDGFLGEGTPAKLDSSGMWDGRVVLAEAFGGALFVFGIAAAIKNKLEEGSQAGLIGGALAMGIFFAVAAGSIGVLNPAVAVGLGVFNLSYIVGPILGAVIGANTYMYLIAKKK